MFLIDNGTSGPRGRYYSEMLRKKRGGGCGRGVLALKSWEPLQKPGANSSEDAPIRPSANPKRLLVKYSYKSNPDQPGGFPELTVKQGQKVTFLNIHPEQELWWNVKDEDTGEIGHVPGSYLMILEDKPSNLPWLENRKLEEQTQAEKKSGPFADAPAAVWKPYVSAYGGSPATDTNNQAKQYYCEICDKQLNGPKPYQAHMVSKAHKEELEAQGLS